MPVAGAGAAPGAGAGAGVTPGIPGMLSEAGARLGAAPPPGWSALVVGGATTSVRWATGAAKLFFLKL